MVRSLVEVYHVVRPPSSPVVSGSADRGVIPWRSPETRWSTEERPKWVKCFRHCFDGRPNLDGLFHVLRVNANLKSICCSLKNRTHTEYGNKTDVGEGPLRGPIVVGLCLYRRGRDPTDRPDGTHTDRVTILLQVTDRRGPEATQILTDYT